MTSIALTANEPRPGIEVFGAACLEALRTHRLYLAIILTFVLLAPIIGMLTGTEELIRLTLKMPHFVVLAIFFACAIFVAHAVRFMITARPQGALLPAMWADFKARFMQPQRIANFLVAVLPVPLFFSTYNSLKRTIPYINPFSWDRQFAEWDKFLHGGVHPYELLQPLLGYPLVTSVMAGLYTFWFVVLMLTVVWQAFTTKNPALRQQFFLTFLLIWIVLGTAGALLLSSAGPIYFDRILAEPGPYQPLLTYIQHAHEQYFILAVKGHDYLWRAYMAGATNFGTGISAMPSMHIAMTTLFAIIGWKTNRILGIAYTVFAVIIQLGSVHLAWHYAIDGYVSTISVLILWWAIGRFMCMVRRGQPATAPA
ncbi:MAG: phosphatase PAP2 family protein [Alphaproteobacteria bacterium]